MTGSDRKPYDAQQAKARTRRAFLTMGVGAATAGSGYAWLRSRMNVDGVEWPLRNVLSANESVARAYFSNHHLYPTFDASLVTQPTRVNGNLGLDADFSPAEWRLTVESGAGQKTIGMDQIRKLPRVEQITELNCIEGWTNIVSWAGARFSDFTAAYAPEGQQAEYVGMETPDSEYFVGLDAASAMHPQTLLCYEMNGAPLTLEHGAPLRLAIPVKYGVKNIKRIGKIAYASARPRDYWASVGYDWYAGL